MLPLTGWAINWYAKTDDEGRYKASSIPAGQYLVGINVRGLTRSIEPAQGPKDFLCPNCITIVDDLRPDEQAGAYPRTFYPGVFQTAKAERLLLSPGQELRNVDFRLPRRPAESIVKGRVLRADGTPVAGAQVSYRDVTYEDLIVLEYRPADQRTRRVLVQGVSGRALCRRCGLLVGRLATIVSACRSSNGVCDEAGRVGYSDHQQIYQVTLCRVSKGSNFF